MTDLLADRVALVTGANGGLAGGIIDALADAGATVVLVVRNEQGVADRRAADIGGHVLEADLTVEGDVGATITTVLDRFGRLDVVVNNAAAQPLHDLLATDGHLWHDVASDNMAMVHLVTRRAAMAMGDGGAFVNIGSIEGRQPAPGHAHYAASKAALAMYTRSAALELGPLGIRANCVSPGLIDDGQVGDRWPEGVRRWNAAAPLPGLIDPRAVGDTVVFLASDLARSITGADIAVDNGILTRPTW